MPRKKYRQQRDDSILDASPPHADAGAEASHAKSPVSHSDDEGNVVIELDTESVAAAFGPIPELAEVAISETASLAPEEAAAAAASPAPEEVAAAASLAPEEAAAAASPAPEEAAAAASLAPKEAAAAASLAPEEAAVFPETTSHIHPVQKIKSESETTATAPTASTPSRWGRFKTWFSSFCACTCACPCTRHRKRRTSIQLKDEPTQQQDAPATAPATTPATTT
jgi:hypothetical protein